MGLNNEDLVEAVIEPVAEAEIADDWGHCLYCESTSLDRMIGRHTRAVFWVVFCCDCGKFLQERWNLLS